MKLHPPSIMSRLCLGILCLFTFLSSAFAQFLTSPQPGDIYKEFVRYNASSGTNRKEFRVTQPTATNPRAIADLPNLVLSFNVADTAGIIRAELLIDYWLGHPGTTVKQFRLNNKSWITIPELGAGNGVPSGVSGECIMGQFNPVIPVPISHLKQGANTLEGTCHPQTCYAFGWGTWGWYGVILRVYYGPGKAHPTGSITSPALTTTIGENPTITVNASGGAGVAKVDLLAYYDGYDQDGDGVSQQYHQYYHRTRTETTLPIRGHVGTKTAAPYTFTWNTDLVPDQGGIKLIARIMDNNGVWFVTNEVTNLTLARSGSFVRIYRTTGIGQRFAVRQAYQNIQCYFNIPASDNLANATSAKMIISTWNGFDGGAAAGESHFTKINTLWTAPVYGQDHFYSLDVLTVPTSALRSGRDTIYFFSNSTAHGIEVLWPGPALVVRYNGSPSNTGPGITQHPADQTVGVGETATFSVLATGTAPLSYQWLKNNVNISGATSSSYTTPPTVAGDDGSTFKCKVTNSLGNITSNAATLNVSSGPVPPVVTTHPANRNVVVGATANFSVVATGTAPLSYQWQKNNTNIGGATSASYTTPATVAGDSGATFRCIVSNSAGSDTSNPATLSVTQSSGGTNVIVNPGFESGTAPWLFYTNGTGSFSTTPSPNSPLGSQLGKIDIVTPGNNVQLYQSNLPLEANTDYVLTFSAYSNTQHDLSVSVLQGVSPYVSYGLSYEEFNLTNILQTFTKQFTTTGFTGTVNDARIRFWFAPYDAAGDQYFIDDVSLQKVGGVLPPTVTVDPANQATTVGLTATFSVTATGTAPLSYQWQKNNTDIGGATNASHTTPATVIGDNGATFRCIVSNSAGKDTSNPATLTVTAAGGVNILVNPSFASGSAPWTFYTNGAGQFTTVSPGSDASPAARIDITTQGTNVQMYQSNLTLEAGKLYKLTFSAYSNTQHDLSASVLQGVSPFGSYGLSNAPFFLSAAWQTFTVQFTASGFAGTVNDGRLRFWFAPYDAAGDQFFIDNVKLEKIGPVPAVAMMTPATETTGNTPTEFSLGANYPNPFNPTTTITFALPEQADIQLRVFDLLGREVTTLASGIHPQGTHVATWDGLNFTGNSVTSGIYFYQLTATGISGKHFTSLQKMILMK